MQREIGVDDSDQSDIRKMQAFRDHLRADEDIDLAGTKSVQGFAIGILARHRVGIHPPNDGLREKSRSRSPPLFPCRSRRRSARPRRTPDSVSAPRRCGRRDGSSVARSVR